MLEVPSLLWQLDELMKTVDFVSVGSNDLFQFVMAADRGNTQLSDRFDTLSVPFLRVLKQIADAGTRNQTAVTLCGELAGKPISAMALIGLGLPLDLDVAGVDRPGQGDADRAAGRRTARNSWRKTSPAMPPACRCARCCTPSPTTGAFRFDRHAVATDPKRPACRPSF